MKMEKRYNRYNDVELDTIRLDPLTSCDQFYRILNEEEELWKNRVQKYTTDRMKLDAAIMWLKLYRPFFNFFPSLANNPSMNFIIHHATDEYIMLMRRRGDSANKTITNAPPYGTHYIKVECLVVELGLSPRYLLVREKYASGPDKSFYFKLVTGMMSLGERLDEACIREVREETNIAASFVGMIGLTQRVGTRFDRDELIVGCVLHAKPGQIPTPDSRELSDAFWEGIDAAIEHCNGPAKKWIKAAGRAGTINLLTREDSVDLRGFPHFVSTFTFNHHRR